jgi:hypothetical protein
LIFRIVSMFIYFYFFIYCFNVYLIHTERPISVYYRFNQYKGIDTLVTLFIILFVLDILLINLDAVSLFVDLSFTFLAY